MIFEEFLRQNIAHGVIDFRIRAHATSGQAGDGLPTATNGAKVTTFYIHPAGKDGMTVDYAVMGDHLQCLGVSK